MSSSKKEIAKNKRREAKRKIITLQTMMRAKDVSPEDRAELAKQVLRCRMYLQQLAAAGRGLTVSRRGAGVEAQHLHESEIAQEEITQRRDFLAANPGLQQTFRTLWLVFFPYTEHGELTREGYLRLQQVMHVALVGTASVFIEDVSETVDAELAHDRMLFGPLREQAFYDLLFETIGERVCIHNKH